ncbi:hypothetical protein DENIT_70022 [Pseudomonas veronii]|uniref:hypothetical protein n=1 Tax=Pseudomonas veronii TaxID=76761 RepID=UPI00176477C3|nr:hypothetical protein [Pseudomonas veronii]CAD0266045.1 hypothetical protein DENIT_70022 [Pseudomonas veronii]
MGTMLDDENKRPDPYLPKAKGFRLLAAVLFVLACTLHILGWFLPDALPRIVYPAFILLIGAYLCKGREAESLAESARLAHQTKS